MWRHALLLFVLHSSAAAEGVEDKKKAIRMKSTPKLKEILTDLGVDYDASIDKEALRELALKEDALTRWEKKHPGQKKAPSKARAAGGGGGGGGGGGMPGGGMSDMFFTMMDKDKDGKLTKQEVGAISEMMAGMAGGSGAQAPVRQAGSCTPGLRVAPRSSATHMPGPLDRSPR